MKYTIKRCRISRIIHYCISSNILHNLVAKSYIHIYIYIYISPTPVLRVGLGGRLKDPSNYLDNRWVIQEKYYCPPSPTESLFRRSDYPRV